MKIHTEGNTNTALNEQKETTAPRGWRDGARESKRMRFRHFEREIRKKGALLPWLLKGTALPGLRGGSRAALLLPALPGTAPCRGQPGGRAERGADAAWEAPSGRWALFLLIKAVRALRPRAGGGEGRLAPGGFRDTAATPVMASRRKLE